MKLLPVRTRRFVAIRSFNTLAGLIALTSFVALDAQAWTDATIEAKLKTAGVSAKVAASFVKYGARDAKDIVDRASAADLKPLRVCRGVDLSNAYDPKYTDGGFMGAGGGKYPGHRLLYTSFSQNVCRVYASSNGVMFRFEIPQVFLMAPCDAVQCVFSRNLIADDRMVFEKVGRLMKVADTEAKYPTLKKSGESRMEYRDAQRHWDERFIQWQTTTEGL